MFTRYTNFAALIPLVAVLGCSEVLDTHSTGTGPAGAGNLPGMPGGDSVNSSGNVTYNGGNIQLSSDPAAPAIVNLVTGGKPHNSDEYLITFSGVKLSITDTPILAIDLLDTDNNLACGLEIAGGEFRLVSGDGTAVIGGYSAQADQHNVIMRLIRTTGRCNIVINQVGQGTDGPPTQPQINASGTFVDAGFGDLDRMRLRWEALDNVTSYFLGPTVISKRD